MPYLQLRFSAEIFYPNHASNALSRPMVHMAEHIDGPPATFQLNSLEFIVKRRYPSLASVSSPRYHHFQAATSSRQRCSLCESHKSSVNVRPIIVRTSEEDAGVESSSLSNVKHSYENSKEEERRKKIGLANKGRVPWNKGRKHTEEARMRIRQRTIEALRDPKVRLKMSQHPQLHSNETKAKISSSLKRLWDKRLWPKRAKERFMLSWSKMVAEAAKKGGYDQRELDWDSYEKLKQEIALEQLQWAEEKTKAKESAKVRAEKAAADKTDKMNKLAQRRKERTENSREKREMRKKQKASSAQLRRRLTKMLRKKPKHGRVAVGKEGAVSVVQNWEKLDLELIKKERTQRELSLAEQIQAAKNRKVSEETLKSSSSPDSQFSIVLAE